jgi:hypothetical protein
MNGIREISMNISFPGLIVVIVTIMVIVLIFWLVRHNKTAREQLLRTLANSNGWTYEPVNEQKTLGYRMKNSAWTIEAINTSTGAFGATSTVMSTTRWFSDSSKLPEGIVMIGPRQPALDLTGFGDILQQAELKLMIGNDADQAKDIKTVELGSLELMNRYMVWTNQAESAAKLLNKDVEVALLNWPGTIPLVVKYSQGGMEVTVQGKRLYKEVEICALVKIGESLLGSTKQPSKNV